MTPEKTCEWYVTENRYGQYVKCNDNHGFCLLQDFFTDCCGKCEDYSERKNGRKTNNKHN